MEERMNARLCFIKGDPEEIAIAYFTTHDIATQPADDWEDVPYEDNADPPLEWGETNRMLGIEPYTIYELAFKGDLYTPAMLRQTMFTTRQINAGKIAWLLPAPYPQHVVHVYAGTTMRDFIRDVKLAGGTIYLPA